MWGIIYRINGPQKSYIGSTTKALRERWGEHRWDARKPAKAHRPMYVDLRAHGDGAFHIVALIEQEFQNLAELREMEREFIVQNMGAHCYNAVVPKARQILAPLVVEDARHPDREERGRGADQAYQNEL